MAWLRLYDDILDDPKIQMLSDKAFRALINLWCLAKRNSGKLPADIKSLSFSLRWTEGKVREVLQALISAHLIDKTETGYEPHNWNARQYEHDVSTERVKRFRERQMKLDETVSETQNETPPDTEQNQRQNRAEESSLRSDSVTRPPKRARSSPKVLNGHDKDFAEFWLVYPKRVAKGKAVKAYLRALLKTDSGTILAGAQRYAELRKNEDPTYTAHPATWLNGECWTDDFTAQNGPDPELKRLEEIEAAFRKERGYE